MDNEELMKIVGMLESYSRGTGKTFSMLEQAKECASKGKHLLVISTSDADTKALNENFWESVNFGDVNAVGVIVLFKTIDQFIKGEQDRVIYPPGIIILIDPEVWVMLLKRQLREEKEEVPTPKIDGRTKFIQGPFDGRKHKIASLPLMVDPIPSGDPELTLTIPQMKELFDNLVFEGFAKHEASLIVGQVARG